MSLHFRYQRLPAFSPPLPLSSRPHQLTTRLQTLRNPTTAAPWYSAAHLPPSNPSSEQSSSKPTTSSQHSAPSSPALSVKTSDPSPIPSYKQPGGAKGPLSAEFLSVSGSLSTIVGLAVIIPLAIPLLPIPLPLLQTSLKLPCLAVTAFLYGIVLSRFDLARARSLKLTIAFTLLTRFIAMPVLSHAVAVAALSLARVIRPLAFPTSSLPPPIAPSSPTSPLSALALPPSLLSSFLLLSSTPTLFSPAVAMLSQHVHTTLLAILLSLTILLFPLLPAAYHALSAAARRVAPLLPALPASPGISELALATTLPFAAAVALTRLLLPPRASATAALCSLPLAWVLSLLLVAPAARAGGAAALPLVAGGAVVCAAVSGAMWVLARLLCRALFLDGRARRAVTLYLATQGVAVAAAFAGEGGAAAAPVAACAATGVVAVLAMGRAWSKVVIRTPTDVV